MPVVCESSCSFHALCQSRLPLCIQDEHTQIHKCTHTQAAILAQRIQSAHPSSHKSVTRGRTESTSSVTSVHVPSTSGMHTLTSDLNKLCVCALLAGSSFQTCILTLSNSLSRRSAQQGTHAQANIATYSNYLLVQECTTSCTRTGLPGDQNSMPCPLRSSSE